VNFDFIYNFCLKHFSERDVIRKVFRSSCIVPVIIVSDFNETWIFWVVFRKFRKISYFIKIRLEGAELFNAERRMDSTDMAKHNSRISQFRERGSKERVFRQAAWSAGQLAECAVKVASVPTLSLKDGKPKGANLYNTSVFCVWTMNNIVFFFLLALQLPLGLYFTAL